MYIHLVISQSNVMPFVSILTACRQAGLVDDGFLLFKRMIEVYRIQPSIEHFTSLVELLSKAGLLHQAEEFISVIVLQERLIAYKTLLSACKSYSEINLGLKIADKQWIKKNSKHLINPKHFKITHLNSIN